MCDELKYTCNHHQAAKGTFSATENLDFVCAQKTLGCIITESFHGAEDFLKTASVNCHSTAQFSKLKLINTYQHTTQHTLYRLTTLSSKYSITKNMDKEKLIEKLHH